MVSAELPTSLRPSFFRIIACYAALVLVWAGLAVWQFWQRQNWLPYAAMSGLWLFTSLYLPFFIARRKRRFPVLPPDFPQKLARVSLGSGMVFSSALFPAMTILSATPASFESAIIGIIVFAVLGQVAVTYQLEMTKAEIKENL